MFPILIAEKIIQNFLLYGLYKEKEEVVDVIEELLKEDDIYALKEKIHMNRTYDVYMRL